MKGLTLDQVKEITEFVQKYHHFARWPSKEFFILIFYSLDLQY